jgi:hypothetical protein
LPLSNALHYKFQVLLFGIICPSAKKRPDIVRILLNTVALLKMFLRSIPRPIT